MKKRDQAPCTQWADKLVLRPDDLTSAEYEALQTHLTTCAACTAALTSYRELTARLRALPRPRIDPSFSTLPELFPGEEERERGNHMNTYSTNNESIVLELPSSRPGSVRKKTVRQRVLALAATVFVTLLTISFAMLSLSSQTANFTITPGWTSFAFYQGTGSQTLHVGTLSLPIVWGHALACQGDGKLDIKLSGPAYSGYLGTDNCAATSEWAIAPKGLNFALASERVQSIQITAPDSMKWQLMFLKETRALSFSLSSAWTPAAGLGGVAERTDARSVVTTSGGDVFSDGSRSSRHWAVLMVCVGEGTGTLQVTPDAGTIALPSCDGQPVLHRIEYPQDTAVRYIQARVSTSLAWFAEVLVCGETNSALCQ